MNRFDIIGNASLMPNPVSPMVSFAPMGNRTMNYANSRKEELKIVPLYDVMKMCASGEWKTLPKGAHSIHAYKSTRKGFKPYTFDGVIFVDIDRFNKDERLKGWQDVIFNRFDELCNDMPNLLCVKYSPSGNLHVYVYHKDIKDGHHYEELARMYTCLLAKVIRHRLGLDLRDYDGALDTHLCNPDQQLNVNDSPVRWNVMCCGLTITKKQKEILTAEYGEFMDAGERRRSDVSSTVITGDGEVKVDQHFFILGWNGYDARTRIGCTAYIHFKKDLERTKEWIAGQFSNAAEIQGQLISLVKSGKYEKFYVQSVEKYLFGDSGVKSVIIPDGKYLSDMVDFDKLTEKYYYLNAGTGGGKTELVKGLAKTVGQKVIILQMNKALRDGKKQGIEEITYDNFKWSDTVPKERVHTTVEGFNRNCGNLDLSEYTVIVDEAHLLQDYSSIEGKREANATLMERLDEAKRVIFMSATPKTETKLFPFEIMKFVKMKDQTLNIIGHPLKYNGKGSKEAARYSKMGNYIRSIEGKHIIFSNKHQECWKKYALDGVDYTWFHSLNITDDKVISILKDNRLMTDITLATIYLGVGVEIKNEKDVHIWFDINEGWDKAFVEQAIGRPRDAERIHLHFFYTEDYEMKAGVLTDEEIEVVENAFDELIVDVDGKPTVNLVAAKMTGIYDANFNTRSSRDKVKLLKVGQIVSNKDYFTINDVELLKQLPYKEIKVRHNDVYTIETDGKKRYDRQELTLKTHLGSRTERWWIEQLHENRKYEDLLMELSPYWNDKKNARTMLQQCRFVWKTGMEINDSDSFFGNMNTANDVAHDVRDYCDVKTGVKVLKEVAGGEEHMEKILIKFKRIEKGFAEDFLGYLIDCSLLGRPVRPIAIQDFVDPMLREFLDIEFDMNESTSKIPYPFKTKTWDEAKRLCKEDMEKTDGKIGGKMGSPKKTITIRNEEDDTTLTFNSKTECRQHLGIGTKAFSRFVKGENIKKLKGWKVVELQP